MSKIGEASDESGDAGDVRYDIRNLNHEEQDGSHSLSLQLGGGLVVGDGGGVTVITVTAPEGGDVSEWEIEEFGSTASVFGAQPTPRLNVFGDRMLASFAKFPAGLPSGSRVDLTSCNADQTVCDSITYTVPSG